jgi:hypothetical protein
MYSSVVLNSVCPPDPDLASASISTVAPAFQTATFGRDPNNLTNADGRLPNDRPHMFRLMGTVDLPHAALALSGNFQYLTGKPWAASAQVSLPQGDQRILIEPRGSRRSSSQTLLDLRVSKPFSVRKLGRIDVMFDVLNVLNDTAGDRQLLQPQLRSAHRLHRPAPGDARRPTESRPLTRCSQRGGLGAR